MTHLVSRSRRFLALPAFAAVVFVTALLVLLARPEAVLRFALDGSLTAAGNRAPSASATALQSRATGRAVARVTVSETGDLIERAADRHALSPVFTSTDAMRPAVALFAVGDRFNAEASGGGSRTLEVIDVTDSGSARFAVRPVGGAPAQLNLVLVTCRVLDAAGEPIPGETVRFLAAAEPRALPPLVVEPAPQTPGTL